MSNKTPYEIRLEILKLAKDYLDQQFHMTVEFSREAFFKSLEAGKVVQEEWTKFIPKSYSVEELQKKAAEMYSFVCDNTSSSDSSKKAKA